jgi:hypothetical protein
MGEYWAKLVSDRATLQLPVTLGTCTKVFAFVASEGLFAVAPLQVVAASAFMMLYEFDWPVPLMAT